MDEEVVDARWTDPMSPSAKKGRTRSFKGPLPSMHPVMYYATPPTTVPRSMASSSSTWWSSTVLQGVPPQLLPSLLSSLPCSIALRGAPNYWRRSSGSRDAVVVDADREANVVDVAASEASAQETSRRSDWTLSGGALARVLDPLPPEFLVDPMYPREWCIAKKNERCAHYPDCFYEINCRYAHHIREMRPCTFLCFPHFLGRKCHFGYGCSYLHLRSDRLRGLAGSNHWKTALCPRLVYSGQCEEGERCCFAHELDEILVPRAIDYWEPGRRPEGICKRDEQSSKRGKEEQRDREDGDADRDEESDDVDEETREDADDEDRQPESDGYEREDDERVRDEDAERRNPAARRFAKTGAVFLRFERPASRVQRDDRREDRSKIKKMR